MHCVLIGNYGVGNLGDEALRSFMVRSFPSVEWTVLSAAPTREGELPRLPGGIRSLVRLRWLRTLHAIRHADAVVFGGGSLFTDAESVYACILWWIHVRAARFFRVPVLLAFQGIGPLTHPVARFLTQDAVRRSVFLSVRDEESFARVLAWNMNINVIQSFDPVYKEIYEQNSERTKNVLVIIPRKNSPTSFLERAAALAEAGTWDAVRILSLEPASPEERRLCDALVARLGRGALSTPETMEHLAECLADASLVLSQRYHGALAALALGIPFETMSQKAGDKLSTLEQYAGDDVQRRRLLHWVDEGEQGLKAALKGLASEGRER